MSLRLLCPSVLVMLSLSAQAQQQPEKRFPIDHPELYTSFCFFVDSFSTWLEERAAADPAAKAQLMEAAGAYLKVAADELPKLTAACRALIVELKEIATEAKEPDPDLESSKRVERRQAAIRGGTRRLQQALSPSSWAGLQKHINGEHRANIQLLDLSPKP
jgi:hypothetical protein